MKKKRVTDGNDHYAFILFENISGKSLNCESLNARYVLDASDNYFTPL